MNKDLTCHAANDSWEVTLARFGLYAAGAFQDVVDGTEAKALGHHPVVLAALGVVVVGPECDFLRLRGVARLNCGGKEGVRGGGEGKEVIDASLIALISMCLRGLDYQRRL